MKTWVVVVGLAVASSAFAKPKSEAKTDPSQDMNAAMAKYSTPGPQHKLLESMLGSWTVAGKMWMDPAKPPIAMTYATTAHAIGKLWVVEDVKGDFMGQPFFGSGTYGYDIAKQKFVSTWVDNFGSYVATAEGTADATGKIVTFMSREVDPATGKSSAMRQVLSIDSDTKHSNTMYKMGADGKETKVMEIVSTKK